MLCSAYCCLSSNRSISILSVYSKICKWMDFFLIISHIRSLPLSIELAHVIRYLWNEIKSVGKIINRLRNSNEIHLQFKMEPYPPNEKKKNEINKTTSESDSKWNPFFWSKWTNIQNEIKGKIIILTSTFTCFQTPQSFYYISILWIYVCCAKRATNNFLPHRIFLFHLLAGKMTNGKINS